MQGCAGLDAGAGCNLGYIKKLTWASLDPPLIETFAVITRDPTNLSPATEAIIELTSQHMRMLHQPYEPAHLGSPSTS